MRSMALLFCAALTAEPVGAKEEIDALDYENAITAAELAALPVEGGCHLAPQDFWNGTPPKHLRFHPGVLSDTELQTCVVLHAALYERLSAMRSQDSRAFFQIAGTRFAGIVSTSTVQRRLSEIPNTKWPDQSRDSLWRDLQRALITMHDIIRSTSS